MWVWALGVVEGTVVLLMSWLFHYKLTRKLREGARGDEVLDVHEQRVEVLGEALLRRPRSPVNLFALVLGQCVLVHRERNARHPLDKLQVVLPKTRRCESIIHRGNAQRRGYRTRK